MCPVRVLVTGVSGYVGRALAPRLVEEGHQVAGLSRDPTRVTIDPTRVTIDPARVTPDPRRVDASIPVHRGDLITGEGLAEALESVQVAYYLVHSMESSTVGAFPEAERRSAENFARAARAAGVQRAVYFTGLIPHNRKLSRHLASRLAVEEILMGASESSVSLRSSIVIGARSRSFRFLVRLVERLRVMVLPAWHVNRTQPLDERDMLEFLVRVATSPKVAGRSLDIAGPDVLTYGQVIQRIAEAMLVLRPALRLPLTVTPVASRVASAIAGEDPALMEPLMESLGTDLLARDLSAARLLDVHLHSFDRAVEHALRDWEVTEPLAAR
jgi:uncharacterized protein YbjT (DUF2867 family)